MGAGIRLVGIRLVAVVVAPVGLTTTLGGLSRDILEFAGLDFEFTPPPADVIDDDEDDEVVAVVVETARSILFSLVDDCDEDEDVEAELRRPVVDGMLDIVGIDATNTLLDRVFYKLK